MDPPGFNYKLIAATCLLLVVANSATSLAQNVCLISPYITSISRLDYKLLPDAITINVTINFELNYETFMSAHNILINSITIQLDLSKSWIKFEGKRDDGEIVYANMQERLMYTKKTYLAGLSKFYYDRRLSSEENAAAISLQGCSESRIYDAKVGAGQTQLQEDVEVWYLDNLRCIYKRRRDFNQLELQEICTLISWPGYRSHSIVSGAYLQPYLFEFDANGILFVTQPQVFPGCGFSSTVLYNGPLSSASCNARNAELALDSATLRDILAIKPFLSVTKFEPSTFSALTATGPTGDAFLVEWRQSTPDGPFIEGPIRHHLKEGNFQDWNLRVISSLPNRMHMHSIFVNKYDRSMAYFQNVNVLELKFLEPTRIVPDQTLPDDIAHWPSCKKIVSIYGFLYTMHEYHENILQDRSKWFKFDEGWLDHKVQALHIEGDKFMFFTKASTVVVMNANPKNCNKLELSGKKVLHYRQVFNYNPKQVNIEGRYFDGSDWIPSWSWMPNSTSYTWLYILIGIVVTVTILIALAYIILRRTQAEQNVIYSKSRVSTDAVVVRPLYLQESTALPLFSDHVSGYQVKSVTRHKERSPMRSAKKSVKANLALPKRTIKTNKNKQESTMV